jgi:hypothetical protein
MKVYRLMRMGGNMGAKNVEEVLEPVGNFLSG